MSDRSVTALVRSNPASPRRPYRVACSTTPSRKRPRHGFVAFGKRRPVTTATCKNCGSHHFPPLPPSAGKSGASLQRLRRQTPRVLSGGHAACPEKRPDWPSTAALQSSKLGPCHVPSRALRAALADAGHTLRFPGEPACNGSHCAAGFSFGSPATHLPQGDPKSKSTTVSPVPTFLRAPAFDRDIHRQSLKH